MNFENALVSRRVTKINEDQFLIEEKWDLGHPECPFVTVDPYANQFQSSHIRQIIMSREEINEINPPLK